MKKILIITPHLSTGGLPQFLLEKIQILLDNYKVYLVEWVDITGGVFVIQRNKIVNILKDDFFTLGEDKIEIFSIIEKIQPDIIHFEEFSETFISRDILTKIYQNKNYYITETTHGTSFNIDDKLFIPDKIMFVSKGNFNQYRTITKDCDVIEFPEKNRKRNEKIRKIGLDPSYKHVLNVGLFTSGKNQGEIFEYAKSLKDYKILFHFIGNQAGNFADYWQPIMQNKPDNCIVWGEIENVSDFYESMDLFLYTSKWENRPLSVLEAIDNNMKVLMYNLQNYANDFARFENVDFLTKDPYSNTKLILESLGLKKQQKKNKNTVFLDKNFNQNSIKNSKNISTYHILTDIDTDREIKSVASLSQLENKGIKYNTIISKRYTELPPKESCQYPEKISLEPGGKLTPGHYGCYLGHRKAFETGYNDNPDYMIIFECDCVIDVTIEDFINKINLACNIIDKTDLLMFSFGFHNGVNIIEKNIDHFVVNKFFGAHAYLIPRKSYNIFKEMYENSKWNVTDLLFAEKFDQYRIGIFETPPTKQSAGYSILDKIYNEDRY